MESLGGWITSKLPFKFPAQSTDDIDAQGLVAVGVHHFAAVEAPAAPKVDYHPGLPAHPDLGSDSKYIVTYAVEPGA